MDKDFDTWNEEKKRLHLNGVNRFYHEREIWWCSLGINIGYEEDGKGPQATRPIAIIKAFSRQLCWAVPLSTSSKSNKYYIPINSVENELSSVIISQMRPVDTKRLMSRIGCLDSVAFDKIKQAIKELL
jgi:mRNA interferase MazF